jgi:hypothetical protein
MAAADSGLGVALGALLEDLIHLWSHCLVRGGLARDALGLELGLKLNEPMLLLIRAFWLGWDVFEIRLVRDSWS